MSEPKTEARPQISPEEMERRKAEINKFHKEQISFLETQFNYEDLLTKIEETRLRRAVAMVRHAQMLAPDPDEAEDKNKKEDAKPEMVQSEEGVPKDTPIFRTLKTDK